MSKLDEAFLKAYRKTPPDAERPAASARRAASLEYDTRIEVGSLHPSVPLPHARFADPPGSDRLSARPVASSGSAALGDARPESAAASARMLRPAFEVSGYLWPAIVEDLVRVATDALHEAVGRLGAHARNGVKTLLVTSPTRGEGRTTMVLALARIAGRRGLRSALVDADFQHPDLARQLGVAPQVGAEDVYRGRQPLAEALIESVDDLLTILPLAGPLGDLTGAAAAGGLAGAMLALRETFDLVLVDAGPLDTDTAALDLATVLGATSIDAALVVRDPVRSTPEQCRLVARRLAAMRVPQWLLAENFVAADDSTLCPT